MLFTSPCDSAASQIVGRHLYCHLIAGQNSYEVHSELTGNRGQNRMAVSDIDGEHSVGQGFNHSTLKFDSVGLCQDYVPPWIICWQWLYIQPLLALIRRSRVGR